MLYHFLQSTFRLRLPIQIWNIVNVTVQTIFKGFYNLKFPQSSYNSTFFYVLLYSCMQLHLNVRRDLVHTIFCCIVLQFFPTYGSVFSLMMVMYSRNM